MVAPAALVGPKALATAFANVVMGRLDRELEKKYQMWKNIERESKSLKSALILLASAVDDQEKAASRTAVARVYGDEIRELTHDIEDCIERFLQRVTCKAGVSRARRSAHAVKTFRTRLRFAAKIKEFKNRVSEARERVLNAAAAAGGAQPSNEALKGVEYVQSFTPVGITEAIQEVLRLLDVEPYQDEAEASNSPDSTPLRVVALLGFGGSGKTTLARAVHDRVQDKGKIPCAWFSGQSLDMDANGIVKHIQDELRLRGGCAATSRAESHDDKENRFLIVIDDIEEKHLTNYWDTLRNAFRDNGRIIVTTTNRSIANKCCNHLREEDKRTFGRVYTMRSLEEQESRQIALLGLSPPRELVEGAKELLKKCGGLPLALSSVARQLSSEDEPSGRYCRRLCEDLGMYLEGEVEEPNFARLRCVLRENYASLSDYNVRNCMLYLGIFPMDHPFKKNVLIRRWLAEGYTCHNQCKDKSVAEDNFKTFIKRSIILPVAPVGNAAEKTCKTLSIMHVFVLHKSMSKKFIMPFGPEHKKVRHFFIHGENRANSGAMIRLVDLSRVRSLTVLGNAGDAISNFNKYEITRVLDLEGCTDVNDGHLKHICKLWNLRYLSLGPNITNIPKEIAQLKLLETLDVSKTSVTVLPVEVIGLPCLTHLIGKFKFEDPVITERLPEQCMLETVAGFVADKGRGFFQLMDRMKKLNKVKILCASGQTGKDLVDMNKHLCKAIRKYIEPYMCSGDVRSLSIDFQGLPQNSESVIDQLCEQSSKSKGHLYYLSSLKLHGNSNSDTLPRFLALFQNLTKLSLSTTVSLTRHILSVISDMALLCSLEMITNSIDGLVIQPENFMSLRHLCLVLKALGPSVLTIEDGGGSEITTLQLICKDLVGISGVEITHLRKLKEIALHGEVVDETKQAWEAEAMNHHNRPCVLLIPGDIQEASSSQEATTTNTISSEEIAHEDHIREEGAAVEEEPAQKDDTQDEPATVETHEDHTRQQEPGAVAKEPPHADHTRQQEAAAVEKVPGHEDHIRQELAAVHEVRSTVGIEVEPESKATASVKSGLVFHFPTPVDFHVNGAQEGGDTEALVLGAGQLRKVALR